jgi:hypothetical protein
MDQGQRPIWLYGVAGAVLLAAAVALFFWSRRPPVVAYDNLKYIQLLRTALSAQRADYLDGVERAIRARTAEQAMNAGEAAHFESIILLARQGHWEQAERAAWNFESAQANRRRPPPEP